MNLFSILLLLALIFLFRFSIFFIGAIKEWKINKQYVAKNQKYKGFVSVVVAAKDEEKNIENAILSISQSNYPKENYEIIVINDRSSDSTQQILDNLLKKVTNLKVLHLTNNNLDTNLKGKAGAIDAGISIAKGDIILMTDADCIVHPNWIDSVSSIFNNHKVGIVLSFTLMKTKRLFDKIQALEWLYLHTMASGGIGVNMPVGCYGNNLAVSKEAYQKVGGYRFIKFSVTEDFALLRAIHKAGYTAVYNSNTNSSVTTLPVDTFSDYVSQHRRWAIGGLALGWIAVLFVISTISIWLGFTLSLVFNIPLFAIAFILLRNIADFTIVFPSLINFRQGKLILIAPIALLFFMLFELVLPFLIFNKKVVWKGQTFSLKK
jgi:cellulose synthase/poly-beta-1,6-N-acetylglucosamine synthase-like glycosyltransferase